MSVGSGSVQVGINQGPDMSKIGGVIDKNRSMTLSRVDRDDLPIWWEGQKRR